MKKQLLLLIKEDLRVEMFDPMTTNIGLGIARVRCTVYTYVHCQNG